MLGVEKLTQLVGRRWPILEKLYEKEYYMQELSEELDLTVQAVSGYLKELGDEDVELTLSRHKDDGTKRKYTKLTEKGRKIVNFFQNLETTQAQKSMPRMCAEPEQAYWQDLKTKLNSANEWVLKAAWEDLTYLGRYSKVWMLGDDFWKYLNGLLCDDENPYLYETINLIKAVTKNASELNQENTLMKIKSTFLARLEEIVWRKGSSHSIWDSAFECIKMMLSEEEMYVFLKKRYTEFFGLKEEEYKKIPRNQLYFPLKSLCKETYGEETRAWLYGQMQSGEPQRAERAWNLYQDLELSQLIL